MTTAIAIIATYNEERFIGGCLDSLADQGVLAYVLDNESTDRTMDIVSRHRAVVGHEAVPRRGEYRWRAILERKASVAMELDADWFLHVDADEVRLPPPGCGTLLEAFEHASEQGCNAVNFQELTFVPTREEPDHDHDRYAQTMRWYYPFLPQHPDRMNAWARQPEPVDLASSGGHRVSFPELRLSPAAFLMKHYLFLSIEQATRKYVQRPYAADELASGWHRARASLRPEQITLESAAALRAVGDDGTFDLTSPRTKHPLFGT